jgi:CBS domain-containing protein
MSRPAVVVSPNEPVIVAGRTMQDKGIKRLPVVDAGSLVGIVTQTDVMRGLISISPLGSVSEVMTDNVATVETAATAAEAARIMATAGISCLIVTHRMEVAGIVTEKDLLRRVVALHKDPATTQVVDIMSFPIAAIPPTYSVLSAGRKMDTMRLHRLVVMDRTKKVCGVVTQTDVMRAVRREIERACRSFDAEVDAIVDSLVDDMERLRASLGRMDVCPATDIEAP